MPVALRPFRVIEVLILGLLLLVGALAVAAPGHRVGVAVAAWAIAGVVGLLFELRFAARRAATGRAFHGDRRSPL